MGFRQRWRSWVMECVATASMSVLKNGSPSKPFKIERGLRQGDLLSPFLFVLVVDVLHRMIGEAVKNGRISPLLVGRDSIELSHLQFADDSILFCPPDEEIIKNYKRLLRCFELMSGLSINFYKSSLIPINCDEHWVQSMCSLLDYKGDTLPVKYLGISLGVNLRGLWVLGWVLVDLKLPIEEKLLPKEVTSYNFTKTVWKGVECVNISVWPPMVLSGFDERAFLILDRGTEEKGG
ncbi:uncharacterized protein LOC130966866 [Arachis stenosperma]|uniref:uncharacterized protein LOC130966866 n=1 Tax=Arachis stenosperma TaxID=217475 RepID=UPI0025AC19F5|nr:uncharacterized protein LOC130966866 [Arachis stenosperma]